MTRWFASVAFVIALALCLTGSTSANNANTATASAWCFGLVHGGTGAIIQPLVECFTDTTNGIIPSVTMNFLNNAEADYLPTIGVMFLLAIAYFGVKLYLGQIERIKAEVVILGLKMAGIMLFLNNAPALYTDLVSIMQQLSQTMSQITTSLHTTGFCANSISYGSSTTDNSAWQNNLWTGWDCIFKYLLGFSTGGFAAASIASFLLMMLGSMGTGFVVFFVGVYLIMRLITAALRFIHVYLMAVLALSFVFCLGFLLVPLLLFKNTAKYFNKWLSMLFGFILTPIMMFAFMGMMLVALDISIFSGQYSVYCKIGGPLYCGNAAASANLFKDITANVIPAGTSEVASGNSNLHDDFWQIAAFSFNGPSNLNTVDTAGSSGGEIDPSYLTATGTGATGVQSQLSTLTGAVKGSNYNVQNHPDIANGGFEFARLDMGVLAFKAGSTCTSSSYASGGSGDLTTMYTSCPWIEGILISLCVALLITYIMGSLLDYIPQLASNMTTRLNDSVLTQGYSIGQSKLFGQQLAEKGYTNTRKMALDYSKNVTRSNDSALSSKRGGN